MSHPMLHPIQVLHHPLVIASTLVLQVLGEYHSTEQQPL